MVGNLDDPLQQLKERTQRLTSGSPAGSSLGSSSPSSSLQEPVQEPQEEDSGSVAEEVSPLPLSPPAGPPLELPREHRYHSELCLASLLLGVLGLVLPLFSVLAIVFGIAGFMQAHRDHLKGKWMAVVGLVLGFLGIIAFIVAIIFSWSLLEPYFNRIGGVGNLLGKAGAYFNF